MMGVPVLSIAGSDPSGGAGIQADLKAIAACGGYGMSVVTALTAQNTRGVEAVHVPPVEFLRAQLKALLSDVPPAAIKIGMLGSSEVIATVSEALRDLGGARASGAGAAAARPPVVLDPVMVATSGDRLLDAQAEGAMARLLADVDIVTPNAPELGALLGMEAASCTADLVEQARVLAREHRLWVLAKGGHVPASNGLLTDVLVSPTGEATAITHPHVDTANTHGTGCTLSSALATFAARGYDWPAAAQAATDYLAGALAAADRLVIGSGHGPVNHFSELWAGGGVAGAGLASTVWEALGTRAEATYSTSVVRGLASGAVDEALMHHYLGQDLAYLEDYAARLSSAAELAAAGGDPVGAAFWEASAVACREEEPLLHVKLGASVPAPDAVTTAYAQHLAQAEAESYAVLAAALLPCFVLYAEVGARLAASLPADASPESREWVLSYADPAFAASAREAMRRVDGIAATASPAVRERMAWAMGASLECEIAFFDR